MLRARLKQLGQTAIEIPLVWTRSFGWMQPRIVDVKGLEYLEGAEAAGTGTLVLLPHIGNWEVLGSWMPKRGPLTSLYEPPDNPVLENWIKNARQSWGNTLVPTDARGVAAIVKALQRGEHTIILPDQQPPVGSGDFADFYGKPARTMTLVYKLIQRTECRVVYAGVVRVSSGWTIHFLPAPESIYDEEMQVSLEALNQGVANVVELAPDQYQWEYKRFRHQPAGCPLVYPSGS